MDITKLLVKIIKLLNLFIFLPSSISFLPLPLQLINLCVLSLFHQAELFHMLTILTTFYISKSRRAIDRINNVFKCLSYNVYTALHLSKDADLAPYLEIKLLIF